MISAEWIRILIVEDDEDFGFLIRSTLQKNPDMKVIGTAQTRAQAVEEACRIQPDIVLMDLCLDKVQMDGIEAARTIRLQTNAKIIILTSYEDEDTINTACKESFASGYIFKSQCSLLTETIRMTATGRTPQEALIQSLILADLTSSEKAVFQSLMGKEIKLLSSPKTIANQKTALLQKLGLKNVKELLHIFH